jgi:predicted phosphodiesterase
VKLWAISDLHLTYEKNRDALEALPAHPDDHLIVAGDVTEKPEVLRWCLGLLRTRFAQLYWVPGNHELWSVGDGAPRGVAAYEAMVEVCRELGVRTPEDEYLVWPGPGPRRVIAPLFLLYDYSFAPDEIGPEGALAWAREDGIVCRDESLLHADPYPSKAAWCAARLKATAARLDALPADSATVLINHFPLRRDLVRLHRIPRFIPWCGTRATEDWHLRYRAEVVVTGHLHMRATDWRDGVRFEEVAVGYPRHWQQAKGWGDYLREILPGAAEAPESGHGGPKWHR